MRFILNPWGFSVVETCISAVQNDPGAKFKLDCLGVHIGPLRGSNWPTIII